MDDPLARQRALVAQHPENELARFSLGKALYDRSRWQEAREHLQAALSKRKDWMVVQILLGKIELQLGNPDGARAAFLAARQLALDQNHEGPLAELDELLSS
jgi:Flp pilus assembly protein TadD